MNYGQTSGKRDQSELMGRHWHFRNSHCLVEAVPLNYLFPSAVEGAVILHLCREFAGVVFVVYTGDA